MFIGAINSQVRNYLAAIAPALDGRNIVVGCSGNFTSEAVLTQTAPTARLHSNDVSLYSSLLGAWATGQEFPLTIADDDYAFLTPLLAEMPGRLAAVMVLLDMLEFHKRHNPHAVRMWHNFATNFAALHSQTLDRLAKVTLRVSSYFAGDVFDHYQRFADDPDAVFCCYAPTYAGGYERLYKALDSVLTWTPPDYPPLTDDRRTELLTWVSARKYLWYDDRIIEGFTPVMVQQRGRMRSVYLYSNIVPRTAVLLPPQRADLPPWKLHTADTCITAHSTIALHRIKTSELEAFKHAYLGKAVNFCACTWAYAVVIDDLVAGFLEFDRDKWPGTGPRSAYLPADFAVPHTRYPRLSKLMVMLATSADTQRVLERVMLERVGGVFTTAFTDKPVSMKYRGILTLVKRGHAADGQKFLNYQGDFTPLTWKETLAQWLTKHASTK